METMNAEAKLDEKALRRPDFRGGWPVRLLDSQEWFVPISTRRWKRDPDSEDGVRVASSLGDEYAKLLDETIEIGRQGVERKSVAAQMNLFRYMLRVNYDLTDDQLDSLIALCYEDDDSDPAAATIRREFVAVASGERTPPKSSTSADG